MDVFKRELGSEKTGLVQASGPNPLPGGPRADPKRRIQKHTVYEIQIHSSAQCFLQENDVHCVFFILGKKTECIWWKRYFHHYNRSFRKYRKKDMSSIRYIICTGSSRLLGLCMEALNGELACNVPPSARFLLVHLCRF